MIDLQLKPDQQLVDALEIVGAGTAERLHVGHNLPAAAGAWNGPFRCQGLYTAREGLQGADGLSIEIRRDHLAHGRHRDAIRCLRAALATSPADPHALNDLGIALKSMGDPAAAIRSYRRAFAADATDMAPLNNLANALAAAGDRSGAATTFEALVRRAPSFAEGHQNRAENLRALQHFDEALASLRTAITLKPDFAMSHRSMAVASLSLARIPAAIASYRRTLALAPAADLHSVLLCAMTYDGATTNEALFAEHRRWATRYAPTLNDTPIYPALSAGPRTRLRIGYVSADLRDHPVARNIVGLVESHDRTRFEIFLYPEMVTRDAVTERFRALTEAWRPTQGLADNAVSDLIRRDGIDILTFVAGHTGSSRISVAAYRPAPVQVSFLGFSTTGLDAVDAWLTDAVCHPSDNTERFTEKLAYLPSIYLFEPPPAMEIAARERPGVIFGSFNNPAKQTEDVYRTWARLLVRTPGSRLRLKYLTSYRQPGIRRDIVEIFRRFGIADDRLDFVASPGSRDSHLADLSDVDVALDPFPFNGCNTTFEALWMGVPVVAMAGGRFLSRIGASLLTQIGLNELIAPDEDSYIAIAAALAADPHRRAALRAGLRARITASPLCDPMAYARSVEDVYMRLWSDLACA